MPYQAALHRDVFAPKPVMSGIGVTGLLTDRLAIVELIGATTTKTGLKIQCALDPKTYEKGIKISDAEMATLNLTGDDFHPEWNYTIKPRNEPDS